MAIQYSTKRYTDLVGAGNFVDIKNLNNAPLGKYYEIEISFQRGDTYPTGGIAVVLKRNALRTINRIDMMEINANYGYTYDKTNQKILLYSGLDTQVSNGTNIAALKMTIGVLGRS